MLYIGVDLGTSAVKMLLMDEDGKVLATTSRNYEVDFPRPGWSEQNPSDWLSKTLEGIQELIKGYDPADVKGIGSGGQMHGLVMLDDHDEVIRPAILWNDGRSEKQVAYLNETIGRDKISRLYCQYCICRLHST
jgi:xylulokinase